jgi:chemotaxis protein MotB
MKIIPLGLILTTTLLLTACVSKNLYQQKTNEADLLSRDVIELTETVKTLRTDKSNLQDQVSKLNNDLSEIYQQNSKLQKNLLAAQANQDRQQGNISLQQQQLADMQTNNDRLLANNDRLLATIEELNQALDKEKVAREARLAKVKQTYNELVGALENEIKRGELTISNLEGQLSVNLLNQILFDSGKTEIKTSGKKVLKSLGDVLTKFPDKALLIEGHTDDVQISGSLIERFPSNWELSTARSTNVVHFLQDEVGLPGERLVAAGYSEYRPVDSNESTEGRAQNRRIQIILVPYESAE